MSGTTDPNATPPGPVLNLAHGTATASTIPLTYQAPNTGGPVITYAGQTSIDGMTWVANSGAFFPDHGTLIGLDGSTVTAATSYHVRVVARNAYDPPSYTDLPDPVVMAVDTETAKSRDDLVRDALIANGKLWNLATGGFVVSGVTFTRMTMGEALAEYNQAVTALANFDAAPPPANTGDSAGDGGGAP